MFKPQVPKKFVSLCKDWHGDSYCRFYAIASTGNLSLGTHRPYNNEKDRYMTDEEWLLYLYEDLAAQLRELLKSEYVKTHSDFKKMQEFLNWTEKTIERLIDAV